MTAIDTTTHADVVCPPDPAALCTCGEPLGEHQQLVDPDAPIVPADAGCLSDAYLAWKAGRPQNRFTLADGQCLVCPQVTTCDPCGAAICSEHSNEFTSCADSTAVLHHTSCRDHCDACLFAIAEDAAYERWAGR